MRRGLTLVAAGGVAALLAASAPAALRVASVRDRVEVVVGLAAPPLAEAITRSRVLTDSMRTRRIDLTSPTATAYLDALARDQAAVARRIRAAIPGARVRWRYSVVANGLAVVVRPSELGRLGRIPGVARIYPNVRYHSQLDQSPAVIGAPILWGPSLTTAGQGLKIGIVDDGVDQSHPFFDPAGYTMPPGFPKGQKAFTTSKVIVARAFAPAKPAWKYADRPFDPELSEHATHVAGIAAGNNGVSSGFQGRKPLSGVAPKAYLGNYKVLGIPTPGVGLDGNSAEIVAGIEAAVRDGMDVINLSLGEPEIEIKRDIVVAAINAAADAGVVPAIAAGNDFDTYGRGSVSSPGSAPKAITAAAATKTRQIATFSSGGPTPLSLQLKPDVTAPGVSILSSVPEEEGLWAAFDGTSMASPHVAGAAALLLQRNPTWTPAQVKSALVLTGQPVFAAGARTEVPTTREGGGMITLADANDPGVFASPTRLSFGLRRPGTTLSQTLKLTDPGTGPSSWTVQLALQTPTPGVAITIPSTVDAPGDLPVSVAISANAPDSDITGFVTLRSGDMLRRVPLWLHVAVPSLGREPHGTLARQGTYQGSTKGKQSRVARYRYPEGNAALSGPEQVFRVTLRRQAANFGVVVLSQGTGVAVEPRVVFAGDENHLTGYAALPTNLNPYLPGFGERVLTAGAIRPSAGSYDVVFDSSNPSTAGGFTFRYWVSDQAPPRVQVLTPNVAKENPLRLRVTDTGSGVDPQTILASMDGTLLDTIEFDPETGEVAIDVSRLSTGRHSLTFQVSDYQETKNMENVAPILPNTRQLRAQIVVS